MGEAYILRRGSGGIPGNWAVIVARVPTGSTVTATKGSITLTPKMWVSEADPEQDIAIFTLTPAQFDADTPWTITATDGTRTASTTVLITTNKEYEVGLSYLVPAEYQAVEYIESANANQYLILAIDKTARINTFAIDITFQEPASASAAQYIIGHQSNSPYFAASVTTSGTTLSARASAGNVKTATVPSAKTQARRLQYNGTAFSYDGTPVISDTYGYPLASNLALMGLATSDTAVTGSNAMRIYEAHIAIGTTTFDLIPCYRKSDSVIGFWDNANNIFRQSDGSRPFSVVGPDR